MRLVFFVSPYILSFFFLNESSFFFYLNKKIRDFKIPCIDMFEQMFEVFMCSQLTNILYSTFHANFHFQFVN